MFCVLLLCLSIDLQLIKCFDRLQIVSFAYRFAFHLRIAFFLFNK